MVRNLCNVASSRERSNKRIVVGIYRLEGTCYTDKVSLAQVEIATVAQDPTYRMLTQGDTVLRDGTFASNAFVDDYYNTVNPHIKSISANWNTNRAVLTTNRIITFDYTDVIGMLAVPLTVDFDTIYVSGNKAYIVFLQSKDMGTSRNVWR